MQKIYLGEEEKKEKCFEYLQCVIDNEERLLRVEINIRQKKNSMLSNNSQVTCWKDIKIEVGNKCTHKQRRLSFINISPVDLVFKAEELWTKKIIDEEQILIGLWCKFPLYNISDDGMERNIMKMKNNFRAKNRIIIPHKLLTLALINYIDIYLDKKTMAKYIKTKYIKGLSPGRRSYATRILKNMEYLVEYGRCWKRTGKEFNPVDFE